MKEKHCDDCWFRGKVAGMPCCDYIFKTGHPRPCPPGEACTEKISRRVNRRKKAKNSAIDATT